MAPAVSPVKEANDQIDDLSGGTADTGKCVCPGNLTDYDGVHCIVELLKKCANYDRKEKKHQLFPDHALGNLICFRFGILVICLVHYDLLVLHGIPGEKTISSLIMLIYRSVKKASFFRREKQAFYYKYEVFTEE